MVYHCLNDYLHAINDIINKGQLYHDTVSMVADVMTAVANHNPDAVYSTLEVIRSSQDAADQGWGELTLRGTEYAPGYYSLLSNLMLNEDSDSVLKYFYDLYRGNAELPFTLDSMYAENGVFYTRCSGLH